MTSSSIVINLHNNNHRRHHVSIVAKNVKLPWNHKFELWNWFCLLSRVNVMVVVFVIWLPPQNWPISTSGPEGPADKDSQSPSLKCTMSSFDLFQKSGEGKEGLDTYIRNNPVIFVFVVFLIESSLSLFTLSLSSLWFSSLLLSLLLLTSLSLSMLSLRNWVF